MRREYQLGIDELICPYCDSIVECDDYYDGKEDSEEEIECEKCGKSFLYTWQIGNTHFKSYKEER